MPVQQPLSPTHSSPEVVPPLRDQGSSQETKDSPQNLYGDFSKLGVPYVGSCCEGILLFWGSILGVPYFRKKHKGFGFKAMTSLIVLALDPSF